MVSPLDSTSGDQCHIIMYFCVQVVEVPPPKVAKVVDTTGAGDAYLGGLIVGLQRLNGLPQTVEHLRCVSYQVLRQKGRSQPV